MVVIGAGVRAEPLAPARGWSRVFTGRACAVWTRPPAQACDLADGVLLGAVARPIHAVSDLGSTWGGYVAVSEQSGRVRVARDPTGRVPAYWTSREDLHLVCSHVEDLADWVGRLDIDWEEILVQLLRNFMPARRTGFRGLWEILPGEQLEVSGSTASSSPVWEPARFWSEPFRAPDQARRALRQAADAGVGFWAGKFGHVMLDLSGGLDSTAVLGLLRAAPRPPQITCLNAATAHEEGDERRFARLAAAAAGAPLAEVDLGESLTLYGSRPRAHLQPRPTSQLRGSGLDHLGLAAARHAGAEAYFTGRGGDHLFYSGIPAIAARDRLTGARDPFGFVRSAYDLARATGEPFAHVLRQALAPPPGSRDLRSVLIGDNPFVRPEAAASLDPMDFAHPWALAAAASAPLGKLRQVFLMIELQRHYDRIGRAENLEEVSPLISQPLLEASLRTPSWMFVPDGSPRGLQRQVFADLLPPEILHRRTKGATTSHAIRTLIANLPYLREHLLDGELVKQGLLDRSALEARLNPDALLDGRFRPGLAECVSAQLWLEQARETLAPPA